MLQGYEMGSLPPLSSSELMYSDSLLQPAHAAMQGLQMNHHSPSQDLSQPPSEHISMHGPALESSAMGAASMAPAGLAQPEDQLQGSDGLPNGQPEQDMENFINIFLQVRLRVAPEGVDLCHPLSKGIASTPYFQLPRHF